MPSTHRRERLTAESLLRQIRPEAPTLYDVIAAFACDTTPREKAVLVAVSAYPGVQEQKLTQLTGMGLGAVKEAIASLMRERLLYITADGGYLTETLAVAA